MNLISEYPKNKKTIADILLHIFECHFSKENVFFFIISYFINCFCTFRLLVIGFQFSYSTFPPLFKIHSLEVKIFDLNTDRHIYMLGYAQDFL